MAITEFIGTVVEVAEKTAEATETLREVGEGVSSLSELGDTVQKLSEVQLDYLSELNVPSKDWSLLSKEQQTAHLKGIDVRLREMGLEYSKIEPDKVFEPHLREAFENLEKVEPTEEVPRRIKTINDSLEGQKHPETGVPYEKKVVETDTGELVEGVFPQFESTLDVQLPEALEQATDKKQFDECNRQLKERCKSDPEFRSRFTPDQLADIEDGYTPDGFTWHHNEVKGKMQLVDTDTHWETRHTGGRNIWGGGTDNRR